jgi:hydroxymethylbilane synthase
MAIDGSRTLRIGSRGSDLARWQANHAASLLRRILPDTAVEIVIVMTTGDRILDAPLAKIGGKGLFTKEIEDALISGTVDLAVHSLKDLPTTLPDGLALGAVLSRTDPSDALVSRDGRRFAELKEGARIGTSSLRRRAQLIHTRRDLAIDDLRGNVPTRLKKALTGAFDAIVLARAGLERLGLLDHATEILSADVILPAPGQGALGIEIRAEDPWLASVLRGLEEPETRAETDAERSFLQALGGGCQVPVGALARGRGENLVLDGMVAEPDGSILLRGRLQGSIRDARGIGHSLAMELISRGAGAILEGLADTPTIEGP